jgi:uncharacterized NAD-dependent epimerase/dehydratase family protein
MENMHAVQGEYTKYQESLVKILRAGVTIINLFLFFALEKVENWEKETKEMPQKTKYWFCFTS